MYTIIEYIWLDSISEFRSKTKVLMKDNITLSDLSDWNYDGSSTKQASGTDSEIIIKPRALFNDPFRGNQHKLVLCDTFAAFGNFFFCAADRAQYASPLDVPGLTRGPTPFALPAWP